jgi:hypothetical protein
MRAMKWAIGAGAVLAALALGAIPCRGQIAPSNPPASDVALDSGALNQEQPFVIQTRDGGAPTRLTSITVPPKPGAPFTLTLETDWVKPMSDGGTQELVNRRVIARDSMGRIYQERWILVPKYNAKTRSQMNAIQLYDPNEHTLYTCWTLRTPKVCTLDNYYGSTTASYKPASVRSGPLPGDVGIAYHEDLGTQTIVDQFTTGTRDTITYNVDVVGNDREMTVIDEHWYSEPLALNLLSIRTDPRFGKQTFKVAKIALGEPNSKLFELPAGFSVVDRRESPSQ